ncbi:MAG TPA: biotin-dependent carboxyltransferase family protein [Solirubrobacteraceae bacterium]|nr:biotin-dependent carboxyltransferase family protein [Solirubrobacteraceae bacterium]
MTRIEVIAPGALTTVQDLGRPGWAHIGVPRSGAADRPALRLANRLVGNNEGAPGLETTLSGPRLRVDGPCVVALTGAPADASVGERPVPMCRAFALGPGDVLHVGTARTGLRTYVAFRGGIDVPLVLGSAATDLLTGLGPARLASGDMLRMGAAWGGRTSGTPALQPPPLPELPRLPHLRTVVGPRDDWFTANSMKQLTTEPFAVNHASNRIGLRLDGPRLDRAHPGEPLSEGLVPGAIQVPADGQPILLLADHPTTGGYPVIAVVVTDDQPIVAQLRPGQQLRFSLVPPR